MKVLLTTVSADPVTGGGTAERTRRLAVHLKRAGHSPEVATIEGGALVDVMRAAGIPVYVTNSIRIKVTWPFIGPSLWWMVRRADIVHILGHWNLLSVATALCARLTGTPYFFSAAGEFAALEQPRPISRLFHILVGRFVVAGAEAIVAITDDERANILKRFQRNPGEVIVIPNGVETDLAEKAKEGASLTSVMVGGGRYILFVGRLALIKGADLLVEAFLLLRDRYPDLKLVLAGPDAGQEASLMRRVMTAGADRIVFTGFLDEVARTEAYGRALVLVVPSRSEAMSLVAIEAGVVGTPVVVTDQCGLNEVQSVGGGAVCEANAVSIAAALDQMLKSNDFAAQGQRWRQQVLEKYTWTRVVATLVEHFEKAL